MNVKNVFSEFLFIVKNFLQLKELAKNDKEYTLYEAADIITRPYTELFSSKDKLIIKLTTEEVFYGEFLEGGKNRIDIINIEQLHNPNKLNGTYSFYRNEIASIKHFKHVDISKPLQECVNIKLDQNEYVRIKEMTKNYVYIEGTCLSDPAYCKAIESLSNVEQIGLAAPGILTRNSQIPLLVLSTWQEVFIFDSSNLLPNYFYPGIKELFESENVCKIVHKGAPLSDILQRFYNIVPKNVIDTEVMDLIIQKSESTNNKTDLFRNVSECLETYLNFPLILNDACSVKSNKWSKRPLKESKMIYASQLAAYLILLKETMYEILFTGLNVTIDNFCEYYDKITSDYEFSEKFCLKKLSPQLEDLLCDIPSLSLK